MTKPDEHVVDVAPKLLRQPRFEVGPAVMMSRRTLIVRTFTLPCRLWRASWRVMPLQPVCYSMDVDIDTDSIVADEVLEQGGGEMLGTYIPQAA